MLDVILVLIIVLTNGDNLDKLWGRWRAL